MTSARRSTSTSPGVADGKSRPPRPLIVRRIALGAGLAAVATAPLALALGDGHLASARPALVISTAAGALAVSALALQPMLAGSHRISWHRWLGAVALALVLVHIGGLFLVEVDDTLLAMSPDGPTRARMALIGTVALIAVVGLGVARRRLPMSGPTWRILHAFLAVLVIVLGFGHAILTDGALDGRGTAVLLSLGAAALLAVAVAYAARVRRAARTPGRS